MKLRLKILLIIVLISTPIISITGWINYNLIQEEITTSTLENLEAIASTQSERIDDTIDRNLERLQGVSSRTQLRLSLDNYIQNSNQVDFEKITKIITDAKKSIIDFENIIITNKDSSLNISTNSDNEHAWWFEEINFSEQVGNNLKMVTYSGEDKLLLFGPLILNGKYLATIIIVSNPESIIKITNDYTGLGETGETFLAKKDKNNNAVFITPLRFDQDAQFSRVIQSEQTNVPIIRALSQQEDLFEDTIDYKGEHVFSATKYIERTGWGLAAKIDKDEALASLHNIEAITIASILSINFIAFVASIIVSNNIAKPILNLRKIANHIAKGHLDVKIPIEGTDEVKDLSKDIQKMANDLEKAQKNRISKERISAKEELAAMITHELKTPITPILLFSQSLLNEELMGKITENQKMAVESILENAVMANRLIADTLDIQKLDLDKLSFETGEFSIKKLTNDISTIIKKIEKDVDFKITGDEEIILKSDIYRIKQVINNIIFNAIDFIPKTNGKIELEIKDSGESVLFVIRDNGKGIEKEHINHIFKKFYHGKEIANRKYGGSGLGLSICKAIVEKLEGKIWVESNVGKGTTFYFTVKKKFENNKSDTTITVSQ